MAQRKSPIAISERKLLLRIVDIICIVVSLWAFSSFFTFFDYIDFESQFIYTWLFTLIFYFYLFGEIFLLYNLTISNNNFKIARSLFLSTFITTLIYTLTPYFSPSLPENRIQIIYLFLLILAPVLIWRFIYMWIMFSPKYFKQILIIGHSSRIGKILKLTNNDGFHDVIYYVSNESKEGYDNFVHVKEANIYKLVKSSPVNEIILGTQGFSSEVIKKLNKDIILLFEEGINIKSDTSFYEEITDRVPSEYLDHHFYKNINLSSNSDNRLYQFFHRFIDLIVSIIGLIVFICILPFVVIANLFANRGPLFYIQDRVGQKGKVFRMYKLRSMVVNAEKDGAVYAQKNDKRITLFGRFLRSTRIDEFPQFFNILKGDMSLIGPRPERPEFVKDLEEQIPFYAIRHVVKPGLTGWAQVKYPYAGSIEEQEKKLRYDLFYIKEQSPFLDFKIIIKTLTTILFFRGQ